MGYPPVIIVDDHDRVVGTAPLREAWDKGLYYRTVQIMVEDDAGRLLLQKRSQAMELFPGRWEVSAAGHVDEGESYESAAKIEAAEELGVAEPQLQELGSYLLHKDYPERHMHHFTKVYRLTNVPATFQADAHEVGELRWFTKAEVKRLIAEQPDQVTDVLKEAISRYY